MSETNTTATTPETTTPTTLPTNVAVKQDVAAKLAESAPVVREAVVTHLVATEIERRKTAVLNVLSKIDEKEKEVTKALKQGTYAFNAAGEKVGEPTFTKEQAEALKKMREEIAKLQKALSLALESNDFQKLFEVK